MKQQLKKILSLTLALMMLFSALSVLSVSAAENAEQANAATFSFDVNTTNWRNFRYICCYIYEYNSEAFWPWMSKKGMMTDDDDDGVYTFTLDLEKYPLNSAKDYAVIFFNDNGAQCHDLLFTEACFGHTAYANPQKKYENPVDSQKSGIAAYWKDMDAKKCGPVLAVTSIGNVVGETVRPGLTRYAMLVDFLINTLDNAVQYSGKSEYQTIMDTGRALGLSDAEIAGAAKDAGVRLEIPVTKVTVSQAKLSLNVGKSAVLKAGVTPSYATDNKVKWASSAPKVASVDQNGKVTAKAAGKATITAAADGKKASCTVTVIQPAVKISLSKTKASLYVKGKLSLKATVSPKTTTNKTVKWAASNKKVVTVDAKGNVVAKAAGKATVTATTANGKKAVCTVTVYNVPSKVTLNKKAVTLKKGKTAALKAAIAPKNAKTAYKWSTSNKKVAVVDKNGKVKALKKGKAVITVRTHNGKTATCKVTVK